MAAATAIPFCMWLWSFGSSRGPLFFMEIDTHWHPGPRLTRSSISIRDLSIVSLMGGQQQTRWEIFCAGLSSECSLCVKQLQNLIPLHH